MDAGLVIEAGGFFTAPRSRAKEQLFSSGSKSESPRTFTLWTEPIITIGALGRLHVEFAWPGDRLGCQSKDWGLDLVCYDPMDRSVVGGEVKKTEQEVGTLLVAMRRYGNDPALPEPAKGPLRNAFKKVVSIRNHRPSLFWAVGPAGHSQVFEVVGLDDRRRFTLETTRESRLNFDGAT